MAPTSHLSPIFTIFLRNLLLLDRTAVVIPSQVSAPVFGVVVFITGAPSIAV
jgi:hypothetical protein